MAGEIIARAGVYRINADVWFEIGLRDQGTAISVHDKRVNRRYSVCFDEHGAVVGGGVHPIDEKQREPNRNANEVLPAVVPRPKRTGHMDNLMKEMTCDPLRRFPALGRYRFTLRYGPRGHERYKCFPLGAYANGPSLFVMYRMCSRFRGERLMKLIAGTLVVVEDESDSGRLPYENWPQFLALPHGTRFRFEEREWLKLTLVDLERVVAGETFQQVHPSQDED